MSGKVKCIRGSKERAEEVRRWLKDHGATNADSCNCDDKDLIYFVKPNGIVDILMNPDREYLFDVEELPRWRAEIGATYFYINEKLRLDVETEEHHKYDDELYSCGNYFKSSEEAGKYRDEIIKVLKERNL